MLFRGLQWGSSIESFKESITTTDLSDYEDSKSRLVSWSEYKDQVDRFIDSSIVPIYDPPTGWYCAYGTPDINPTSVFGYRIAAVDAYFYYGVIDGVVLKDAASSRLYMAEYLLSVKDIDSAFIDIKEILTDLYGEGVNRVIEGTKYEDYTLDLVKYDVTQYLVSGDNETSVLLEKGFMSEHGFLLLAFGQGKDDTEIQRIKRLINNGRITE